MWASTIPLTESSTTTWALITGIPVPGFPFLASCLAVFSGVQLFALGIIGEYMARIHFRTVEKPQYAVRRRLGHG